MAQKCAGIFVLGHNLYRKVLSFPRATLLEKYIDPQQKQSIVTAQWLGCTPKPCGHSSV